LAEGHGGGKSASDVPSRVARPEVKYRYCRGFIRQITKNSLAIVQGWERGEQGCPSVLIAVVTAFTLAHTLTLNHFGHSLS
jgi:hypothetical protein